MSKSYFKDEKFLKKFGTNMKTIRKSKGVSQEALANDLGFSQPHIVKIELGHVNTSISHAYAIAKSLKVPLTSLFDF